MVTHTLEKQLSSHLKKTTIISNIVSVIAAFSTAFIVVSSFYYKTIDSLQDHSAKITTNAKSIEVIKEEQRVTQVNQAVSAAEMQAIKERMNSMEKKIDKIDDKLDKILLQTK